MVRWANVTAVIALCALVLGWSLFASAWLSRGLHGRWAVGSATLLLLIAATMSSCIMV
jgi:hypothetical protein